MYVLVNSLDNFLIFLLSVFFDRSLSASPRERCAGKRGSFLHREAFLDIVVQGELIGMRTQGDLFDLLLTLVLDIGFNEVLIEDPAL
ncbi:hypothetical protein CTKA_02466 [Chthonomonas calidirosea]|uniref:Uncharacterized protein n=1 Tax=Chthonomonas calidirosea (strain DSM 23976 / ICMP 18418 / T49) TaxID=1303518 RepID=S0EUU6_CHTCT|nr:hypothetical protein CCALI_01634 [Chthonomonas calidirosea T49]CEK20241.1 hypothetical protein CTKA_02466 [Chthonomonas calidirosea]